MSDGFYQVIIKERDRDFRFKNMQIISKATIHNVLKTFDFNDFTDLNNNLDYINTRKVKQEQSSEDSNSEQSVAEVENWVYSTQFIDEYDDLKEKLSMIDCKRQAMIEL